MSVSIKSFVVSSMLGGQVFRSTDNKNRVSNLDMSTRLRWVTYKKKRAISSSGKWYSKWVNHYSIAISGQERRKNNVMKLVAKLSYKRGRKEKNVNGSAWSLLYIAIMFELTEQRGKVAYHACNAPFGMLYESLGILELRRFRLCRENNICLVKKYHNCYRWHLWRSSHSLICSILKLSR